MSNTILFIPQKATKAKTSEIKITISDFRQSETNFYAVDHCMLHPKKQKKDTKCIKIRSLVMI